jgi:hypothetical protein
MSFLALEALRRLSLMAPAPGFAADPCPWCASLRTHEPVHELVPGVWLLTRCDDVLAHGKAAVRDFLAWLDGPVTRRRAAPDDPAVDALQRDARIRWRGFRRLPERLS